MPTQYGFPLFPLQSQVLKKLMTRVSESKPSIIWAGRQSGVSTICAEVSQILRNTPQIFVSNNMEGLAGFHCSGDAYAHPMELPLAAGREEDNMWSRITPYTVVFVDGLFNMPDPEHLYARLVSITPHVIAWGQIDPYENSWPTGKYLSDLIGPYASWELNPLLDMESMRVERMNTLRNHRKFDSARVKEYRRHFNKECAAAVNSDDWKFWSRVNG